MEALAGYLLFKLIILNPICKLSLTGDPEDEAKIHPVLCLSGFFDITNFHLTTGPHLLPLGTPPTRPSMRNRSLSSPGEWAWRRIRLF
jgi:hypothetical protein